MVEVEKIKGLNIDGIVHEVDTMSDKVKSMVDIFDDWNLREVKARDELMLVQAAKNDLSRQIILQVRSEEAEKVKDSVDETANVAQTSE